MSRGLGKLQLACMESIVKNGPGEAMAIAARTLGRNDLTTSECEAFRRALRQLAHRGLVFDMGRTRRFGRRAWGTKDQLNATRDRELKLLGKSKLVAIP